MHSLGCEERRCLAGVLTAICPLRRCHSGTDLPWRSVAKVSSAQRSENEISIVEVHVRHKQGEHLYSLVTPVESSPDTLSKSFL